MNIHLQSSRDCWIAFWLMIAATTVPRLVAADVSSYIVEKSRWFVQTNGVVSPAARSPGIFGDYVEGPYEFFSLVNLASQGTVSSASITPPGGGPARGMVPRGLLAFIHAQDFASQEAMDAAYPNGTYTVSMTTVGNGLVEPTLDLGGNHYPNIPQFSNYEAAQSITTASNFTLVWSPFVGATADDAMAIRVFDLSNHLVFSTPIVGLGALSPASTNGVIPGGTLISGREYLVELLFLKIVNFNFSGYPGAVGVAEYDSVTTMRLKTGARLIATAPPSNGMFNFQAAVAMGKFYEIQFWTNVEPPGWGFLTNFTANSSLVQLAVPAPTGNTYRVFRLLEK